MLDPMTTIIAHQQSTLTPPDTFMYNEKECAELIRSLTIKHIKVWEYPHKTFMSIEYDSLLMGATFTFIQNKRG